MVKCVNVQCNFKVVFNKAKTQLLFQYRDLRPLEILKNLIRLKIIILAGNSKIIILTRQKSFQRSPQNRLPHQPLKNMCGKSNFEFLVA